MTDDHPPDTTPGTPAADGDEPSPDPGEPRRESGDRAREAAGTDGTREDADLPRPSVRPPEDDVEVVELDLGDEEDGGDGDGGLSTEEERNRLLAQLAGGAEDEEDDGPPEPEVSSADERARMLEDVVRDTETRKVFQRVATREPGVSVRRAAVALILVVAAAGAWVWQPAFLEPSAIPARDPDRVEAALRFAVTLQAERLLARRTENRRLPDLLREAGDTLPGLTYERPDGGSFVLEARSGDVTVRYSSRTDLTDFLGNAPLILAEGS